MSVKYHVIQRGNPLDQAAPKKFFASFSSNGEITLKRLSERIAQISTVSRTDTLAVLTALLEVVPQELTEGQTVRLGDLGSFSINISSEGSDTADKVTAANIRGAKVVFRPGKELKDAMKTIQYEKEAE
ncbi:HU family DNA-binding protein [Saccharicrinis sp. FJH2]|uniref:HU family DNA-binding protein n=1 Tax=Saccharicrinis sp. FJH65 TaxID=3344659 RepID=UPI0035F4E1F4